MLGLLWLSYASFGIIMGTIPPLVEPIVEDLGITYSQMGIVLGAWQLVYIVTSTPIGALVDKLGPKRAIAIGIAIIWVSLVCRGIAVDFTTLFMAVALFGFGGPIISIGAPKVVGLWFIGKERGLAAGIYTTAPICGMAISLATAPSWVVATTGSWRGISMIYGIVVLFVLLAWCLFARDRKESPEPTKIAQIRGFSVQSIMDLLKLRNMRIMLIIAMLTFLLNHGVNNWLPSLLVEQGRTIAEAGSLTAAGTAFGAIGLLVILRLSNYGRRKTILGLLILASSLTTAGLTVLKGNMLLLTVLISCIARNPLMPVSTLILLETPGIGADMIGLASGLFFTAAEIGGFLGPFLLGHLRESLGTLSTGFLALSIISGFLLLFVPFVEEKSFPTQIKS